MEEDDKDTIFGDLEDQCTCWVCFEIFEDPVTLHCAHSFCKECALKVHKKNPCCPFCRRPFDLPLPEINKEVVKIVERYLKKKLANDQPMPSQPLIEQDAFILQLPEEVILDILSYLPPKDVGKTSKTCRDLNRLADDAWLWREFCQNAFPFCSVDKYGKNWKHCFIGRSNIHKGWEGGKAGDFEVITMRGHKNYVNCFRLYRNNIVSGSADNTLKVWKTDSSDPIHTLVGHTAVINCVEFNETHIISGASDNHLKIWDTKSGLPIHTVSHNGAVNCARFDESRVVSGGNDNTIKVWDIRQGTAVMTLGGHWNPIRSLEFDSNRIVSCGYDAVKVWDIRNGNMQRDFQGGNPTTFKLAGNNIVVGRSDGDVLIYDISNGSQVSMAPRVYAAVNEMACDGKTVITACNDGSLRTYDLARKTLLHTLTDHKGPVHTVQLSGNKAVSGGSDNCLKVWDLKKGTRLYTLLGGSLQQRSNNPNHPSKPGCSHLEFDDSRIVASFASLVRIYDFETYKPPS